MSSSLSAQKSIKSQKNKPKDSFFEKKLLHYLITYFQGGSIYLIDYLMKEVDIQIDNIFADDIKDFLKLCFIKNLSQESKYFKYFLHNWGKKITLNTVENPLFLNNRIKGKIMWKETLRERNFLEYPLSIKFVCKSYENDFNSLENMLIKSFLHFLKEILEKYEKSFNYDIEKRNQNLRQSDKKNSEQDWKYYAFSLLRIIKNILNNYYMRDITLKKNIWRNSYLVSRALRKSNKTEHLILTFAYRLKRLLISKDPKLLSEYFLKYLIIPNKDKMAELYVLFSLIEIIIKNDKKNESLSLISPTSKRSWIFEKEFEEKKIRIFYQKKPKDFTMRYPIDSTFKKTLKFFNLSDSFFIPDIIVDIESPNLRKFILVEVKNSSNWSYIRSGLLQLCNYFDLFKPNRKTNLNVKDLKIYGLLAVKSLQQSPEIKENLQYLEYPIQIIEFDNIINIKPTIIKLISSKKI